MATPSDESLPLEFSESSTKRRAPKKLQNIGIGQFKRPGVAHHLQPGSAAAIFNKQKAEQQTEAWLRRAPTNAPQDGAKGKGKRKAKKGAKSRKDEATSTTTKDGDVEGSNDDLSTRPVVAVAQMGQGKSATEHGKAQDQTQGVASTVAKARIRKVIKVVTVDRRVKPTQGAWGQRAVKNAKHAAAKAVTTSYSTTPIIIDAADGELSATVMPTPKLPAPEPVIPRVAAVQPKSVPVQSLSTKTVRKPATKSRVPKKSQAPMWSDSDSENDDQDQDDIYDLLLSSRTAGSTTKTTRGRTTKNSSTSKNSSLRDRPTRNQPKPQKKRQVRFAPTISPEEEEEEEADESTTSSNTTANQTRNPNTTSQKQQTNQQPPTPYSTLDLPQANFHIPSQAQPKQTPSPSPAELADDEDSYVLSAEKEAPIAKNKSKAAPTPSPRPAFTPNPFSASAKKRAQDKEKEQEQEQERPPRRKGVAHPPQAKRARATTTTNDVDDDNEANDSAAPMSKKAKTGGEKTKSTTKKKQDLPARKKKGVATKVMAKRVRAAVRYESDSEDDDE